MDLVPLHPLEEDVAPEGVVAALLVTAESLSRVQYLKGMESGVKGLGLAIGLG